MERLFLVLAGAYGLLGVAFGAFGAHALRGRLAEMADGAKRLEWWQTAAQYHLVHALALGLAAYVASRSPGGASTVAGWCFAVGVFLFSGSLYTMTLTGVRVLGAVTPFGGALLIVGWLCILLAGLRVG